MTQTKHCHKFNDKSMTFSEIMNYVNKNNGEKYAQPSSIKSIYVSGLKKVLKNYLKNYNVILSDDEINKLVLTFEIQQLLYELISSAYSTNNKKTIENDQNDEK